jgi:hypothetical protein
MQDTLTNFKLLLISTGHGHPAQVVLSQALLFIHDLNGRPTVGRSGGLHGMQRSWGD